MHQEGWIMRIENRQQDRSQTLIKKCHQCGTISENGAEPRRCTCCNKAFLPSNYFSKVHAKSSKEFDNLFSEACELKEEELIKGLTVLW
jgi:hypothetical protein